MYSIEDNIYAKDTHVYGKSLFAKRSFMKDEIVFVPYGSVVLVPNTYTIPVGYSNEAIDEMLFIDPQVPEGNLSQFICHSCEPNLGVKNRTLFVAMRDIDKDEEITIDYAMIIPSFSYQKQGEVAWKGRTCLCGRATCRKIVQSYSELSDEKKTEYKGYFSDFFI